MKSDAKDTDGNDDGYVVTMNYKGASSADKGSYGLWAKYYDQASTTFVSHTTDADHSKLDGFKGYGVGFNYTLAKNIVGTVEYYDLDAKVGSETTKTLWSDVTFSF